jgi:peptidoglycan-associated lipoprotein
LKTICYASFMNAHKAAFLVLSAALAASACAPHARKTSPASAAASAAADGGASAASRTEPEVRDRLTERIPGVEVVRFAYDSDMLDEAARAVLRKNAAWLKQHEDAVVQITGHCDPRGTVEYNLALGQRRASSVRAYYISLGVAPSRLATISFGKEQPACTQATEECYRRDRRAETLKAVPAVANTATERTSHE